MQFKTRAELFTEMAIPADLAYRTDPVRWATERARVELWSKQREILNAVVEHPRVAIHSSHSTGKSFTMGLLTCWWIDVHPPGEARVITTAPTSPQVDAILWNEINQHHQRLNLQGHTNKRQWYIGRFLAALGRKPPDHIEAAFQGLHARYLLVLLDEAYGIPNHLWDEAESLASNENARMVAVGNPDGDGRFQQVCGDDSAWHKIHISYKHTPNFTGEQVSPRLREMLVSRTWVEARAQEWGEESALFQSKCDGVFPKVGSPWQVVPHEWVNRARYRELVVDSEVPTEAGVDVGAGNDRTVVSIRRGAQLLHVQVFVSPDPVETVGAIALVLREWDVQAVKVDSIGIGWGIYGHLRSLSTRHSTSSTAETAHDASVIPVNVGEGPSPGNEHRFLNRRAELWWDVGRENARLGQWDFTRVSQDVQNTIIFEMTLPRYQVLDSRGKVKIEEKKEIRKRTSGASPDVAESVLLAYVPASWTARLNIDAMLNAPSLLTAASPGDMTAGRGVGHERSYDAAVAGRGGGGGGGGWSSGARGW